MWNFNNGTVSAIIWFMSKKKWKSESLYHAFCTFTWEVTKHNIHALILTIFTIVKIHKPLCLLGIWNSNNGIDSAIHGFASKKTWKSESLSFTFGFHLESNKRQILSLILNFYNCKDLQTIMFIRNMKFKQWNGFCHPWFCIKEDVKIRKSLFCFWLSLGK